VDEGAELEGNLAMEIEKIDPVGPVDVRPVNSGMCQSDNDGRSDRRKFGWR